MQRFGNEEEREFLLDAASDLLTGSSFSWAIQSAKLARHVDHACGILKWA